MFRCEDYLAHLLEYIVQGVPSIYTVVLMSNCIKPCSTFFREVILHDKRLKWLISFTITQRYERRGVQWSNMYNKQTPNIKYYKQTTEMNKHKTHAKWLNNGQLFVWQNPYQPLSHISSGQSGGVRSRFYIKKVSQRYNKK